MRHLQAGPPHRQTLVRDGGGSRNAGVHAHTDHGTPATPTCCRECPLRQTGLRAVHRAARAGAYACSGMHSLICSLRFVEDPTDQTWRMRAQSTRLIHATRPRCRQVMSLYATVQEHSPLTTLPCQSLHTTFTYKPWQAVRREQRSPDF